MSTSPSPNRQPGTWPDPSPIALDADGKRIIERDAEGTVTAVGTKMNYQQASVESSLLRNGLVGSIRDATGHDTELFGVKWEADKVMVNNARLSPKSIHKEGFQVTQHDVEGIDFTCNKSIVESYYPSVCKMVAETVGASHVYAFDHNVRTATGKAEGQSIKGGNKKQGAAHMVHTDYTQTSSLQRLRDLATPAKVNDTWKGINTTPDGSLIPKELVDKATSKGGRWAIINVWRNIKQEVVQKFPLAVMDAKAGDPNYLVTFEIHYADRVGENYFVKYSDKHKWNYFPAMAKSEALVFKQWDSDDQQPKYCIHTAFEDPTSTPESDDRESIEVRCMALFVDE